MLFFTEKENNSKYIGTCPKFVGVCVNRNDNSSDRYILKPFFKNRTDGLDELLSALFAKALNLQIPNFDICYVKLDFLNDDCWLQYKRDFNLYTTKYQNEEFAIFFASKFMSAHKAINIPKEYENIISSQLESYLLEFFDLNILNLDRTLDNLLINKNGFVIIDHNMIFCGCEFQPDFVDYIKKYNCEKIVIDKFKNIKNRFLTNLILYSEARDNFLSFDINKFCNDLELNIAKLNFQFTDSYKLAIDRRKEILKYQNKQIGDRYENGKVSSN